MKKLFTLLLFCIFIGCLRAEEKIIIVSEHVTNDRAKFNDQLVHSDYRIEHVNRLLAAGWKIKHVSVCSTKYVNTYVFVIYKE